MNKKLQSFIKEMKKNNYKQLTKLGDMYPIITFADMGIKDHWVKFIIEIATDDLTIHQIVPIDGFTTKKAIIRINNDVESAKQIAESEVK